jgi:hypothetical protein
MLLWNSGVSPRWSASVSVCAHSGWARGVLDHEGIDEFSELKKITEGVGFAGVLMRAGSLCLSA